MKEDAQLIFDFPIHTADSFQTLRNYTHLSSHFHRTRCFLTWSLNHFDLLNESFQSLSWILILRTIANEANAYVSMTKSVLLLLTYLVLHKISIIQHPIFEKFLFEIHCLALCKNCWNQGFKLHTKTLYHSLFCRSN